MRRGLSENGRDPLSRWPGVPVGSRSRVAGGPRRPGARSRLGARRRSCQQTIAGAGAFDGAREGGACRDAHLVEDVAQVGLDGFLAQVQFRGDLRVGLAVDDEPCYLQFTSGEGLDACPVGLAWLGAPVGTLAELSQFSLRALAVAPRAAGVERCRRALKFGYGAIPFAGFGERSARNRARQRGLDRGSDSVGRTGR